MLLLSGCQFGTEQLTGQVFVKTEDHGRLKLGGVLVKAYPLKVAVDSFKAHYSVAKPLIRDLYLDDLAREMKYVRKVKPLRDTLFHQWSEGIGTFDDYTDADDLYEEAVRRAARVLLEAQAVMHHDVYMASLPEAVDSSYSNKEGQFQLGLKPEVDYLLVAETGEGHKLDRRRVWAIGHKIDADGNQIELNDDNAGGLDNPRITYGIGRPRFAIMDVRLNANTADVPLDTVLANMVFDRDSANTALQYREGIFR